MFRQFVSAGSRCLGRHGGLQRHQHERNHFVTMLLLLMMLGMGSGSVWGQTSYGKAEINAAPTSSTVQQIIADQGNVQAWYINTTNEFNGYGGKQINDKWFVTLSDQGFIKIKVAKGSVIAGDILRVETIDIYQNSDQQNLGFKVEGSNGTVNIKETDNAIHTLDYTLKAGDIRNDSEDTTCDYIQINRNGNSGCGYHSVEILQPAHFSVSIDLAEYPEGLPSGCDAWFTLNDEPTQYREAKTVVEGTTVTYTMSSADPHNKIEGWRTESWHANDVGWMGWSASFTTTIRSVAMLSKDGHDCKAEGHSFAQHEQMLYGNINAAPEFTHQEGCVVTFGVVDASGNSQSEGYGSVSATVDGQPISSGQLVESGKTVTFTALPNPGKIAWGWYDNSERTYKDVTVQKETGLEDITMNAVIHDGIYFNAESNNEALGSVHIECNGDRGTSFHTNPGTPDIHFIATATTGANFIGWYNNEECTGEAINVNADYELPSTNEALSLWAKFETTRKTYDNLTCGTYTFDNDLSKLIPGGGATGSAPTFSTDATGGYVCAYFDKAYNLSDLNGWTITTSDNSQVSHVVFFNGDTEIRQFWTNATNRTGISNELKQELKSVTEFRIVLKENASDVTFNSISFDINHSARTKPTLIGDTKSEMTIPVGKTVTISNEPGYWREYSDDTYQTVVTSNIPSNEWNRTYTFTGDKKLSVGNHYFRAIDGIYCALEKSHQSEPTDIVVHVVEPACDVTTTHETVGDKLNLEFTKNASNLTDKQVTIEANNITVDEDKCIKLIQDNSSELIVKAPDGYRVKFVRVKFCTSQLYNVSFNRGVSLPQGTAEYVDYTNNTSSTHEFYKNVRMAIRAASDQTECTSLHIQSVYVTLESLDEDKIDEDRHIGERPYRIYVPEKAIGKTNVPVVFSLHGTGGTRKTEVQNFNTVADQNGFIVVYPEGQPYFFPGWGGTGNGWMATGAENSDTEYLVAILDQLTTESKDFSIDANRVYLSGYSNGGMMAYAMANLHPDKFAAFASISGLPVNEMHLRHHGKRPMPFLHIHGTKDDFVKYSHMPTIIDNMLQRSGLDFTPSSTQYLTSSSHGCNVKKTAWGNESNKTDISYVYYEVGNGMKVGDAGMGHSASCTIDGKSAQRIMWEYFEGRTLTNSANTDLIFKAPISISKTPDANDASYLTVINNKNAAIEHGWTVTDGRVIAQYGNSGGLTNTNQNVYRTIQIPSGKHWIKLNAIGGDSESLVNIRLVKLGDIDDHFNTFNKIGDGFSVSNDVVVDKNYYTNVGGSTDGNICFSFDATGNGEYQLTISKSEEVDNITISNIEILNNGTAAGKLEDKKLETDFTGFFNYNNRLCAQWNFDLSDAFRFNAEKIKINSDKWEADYRNTNTGNAAASYGTVIYKFKGNLGTSGDDTNISTYDQLTYDGTTVIPATAGLKFKTDAPGHVKMQVKLINGVPSGAQLIVDEHVKLYIPYVENSYRPDNGYNDQAPFNVPKEESERSKEYDYFRNCMHHKKRDIIYMSLASGTVWREWTGDHWENGHVKNQCIDDASKTLFITGGEEFVNDKKYYKMNYQGTQGMPCVMQFETTTTIDRIGVNRNLTYSFYSEYINELGFSMPQPRTRIIGSPKGALVANSGLDEEWASYDGAIAMTYGGWPDDRDGYSAYTPWDGNEDTLDRWNELGVYNGGEAFYTWTNMPKPSAYMDVPVATDGFPVFSRIDEPAYSETVMSKNTNKTVTVYRPEKKDNNGNTIQEAGYETVASYHPAYNGQLINGDYQSNVTPWSLPCRGAYLKFEPTRPGVLNVHILQRAYATDRNNNKSSDTKATYYIADEFGKIYPQDEVYCKTAQNGTSGINKVGGGYQLAGVNSDYAKYSFNVYPGKTYYMFSNDAGLGMTGFYYEPDVYRSNATDELARIDVGMDEISLNEQDGDSYSFPTGLNRTINLKSPKVEGKKITECGDGEYIEYPISYNEKAVTVKIKRSFTEGVWNSICLPFSMNQVEMEQVFGKGTNVILLRDIQPAHRLPNNKTTLNYIIHENQDIIAGYPYFIKPTKTISEIKANVCLSESLPEIVSIRSEGPLTIPSFVAKDYDNSDKTFTTYEGIEGWTFKGNYESQTLSVGSYALDKNGNLGSWEQNVTLKPYRAALFINEPTMAKALPKIEAFARGLNLIEAKIEDSDITTSIGIDQVLQQQGIFLDGVDVYGTDGKKIHSNVTRTDDLPKGIYIINKKKYVIK